LFLAGYVLSYLIDTCIWLHIAFNRTRVILFFSFTERKEKDKSMIATMTNSSNKAGPIKRMIAFIISLYIKLFSEQRVQTAFLFNKKDLPNL